MMFQSLSPHLVAGQALMRTVIEVIAEGLTKMVFKGM